jgi:hypothetical protein
MTSIKKKGEVFGAEHVYTTILVYGLNPMINVILFAFNPLGRVIRANHTQMVVTHYDIASVVDYLESNPVKPLMMANYVPCPMINVILFALDPLGRVISANYTQMAVTPYDIASGVDYLESNPVKPLVMGSYVPCP